MAWPAILDHLQRLRTGSTVQKQRHAAFGVVCPLFGASKVYYTELLSSISAEATKLGYPILIAPIANPKYKRTLIAHFPQLLSVAGVILITCQVEGSTWLEECASHNLPVVLVHDNIPEERVRGYSVTSYIRPELAGLRDLVFFLVDRRSRKNMSIVLVDPQGHALRTEKLRAIQTALGARGLDLDLTPERQVFYVSEYSYSEGYEVTDRILDKNPNTDSIVCLADVTAVAVVHRLKSLGKAESISVTGFDNIDAAEYNDIATVDQQLGHSGRTAAFDLYRAVSEKAVSPGQLLPVPVSSYIPTTFVRRGSA